MYRPLLQVCTNVLVVSYMMFLLVSPSHFHVPTPLLCDCSWLLESAERLQKVTMSLIPGGLLQGLSLSSSTSRRRTRSSNTQKKNVLGSSAGVAPTAISGKDDNSIHCTQSEVSVLTNASGQSVRSSLHRHPLYTPSFGSRSSNQSLLSNTVDMAAQLGRSSQRSRGEFTVSMHAHIICCFVMWSYWDASPHMFAFSIIMSAFLLLHCTSNDVHICPF